MKSQSFAIRYDSLVWDGNEFTMPCFGRWAKFATMAEALDSLRAKYGDSVQVQETCAGTAKIHGYIQHWLAPLSESDCVRPMIQEMTA